MQNLKQLIEKIFNETGQSERDAENLANALTRLTGDLYTETERFIFELLQNADDIPNETGLVNVVFVILREHFLILHNGKPFDSTNVDAISSISKSTKVNNSEQTGYKGIGFKSVFADSECVYINSGNFSFKFDRNDKRHKNIEKTPWQIKPIWIDKKEYPVEIQQYQQFFTFPVATAIYVGQAKIKEYKTKLEKLFQDPRLILFLRHVQNINVIGLNNINIVDVSITKEKQGEKYKICRNNQITYWLVQDFDFNVPKQVKDKMKSDKKIPDKLKLIERSKITFAAQLIDNKLVAVNEEDSVLFTYLPTNVKEYKFPFLVNADFLTTANRQEIHHDNPWNIFLFTNIAYYSLTWIAEVAKKTEYRNQVINILPSKFSLNVAKSETFISFNQELDQALELIAFIPSEEDNKLLTVNDSILDETEITRIIQVESVRTFFDPKRYFISNLLLNKTKLKNFGVKSFDVKSLCSFLKSTHYKNIVKSNPQIIFQVLAHLKTKNLSNRELLSIEFILDENSNFASPQILYFQIYESEKKILNFAIFYFIHPDIDEKIRQDNELFKWAKNNLRIKIFDGCEILKERINQSKYIPDIKSSINNYINYVRFIFKYYSQLNYEQCQKLNNLKLIYHNQEDNKYYLDCAYNFYLSDFYKPKYPTEEVANLIGIENFKFVISDYYETPATVSNWKDFLLFIGVKDPNGLDIISNTIIPMITNNAINDTNTINITRYIFNVWKTLSLSNEDIESLHKLPLLTNNGLEVASECNLSEFYTNEEFEDTSILEVSLPNLISNKYYQEGDSIIEWKRFFTGVLGVFDLKGVDLIREKIHQIVNNSDIVNSENAVDICRQIFKYRTYLTQEDFQKLHGLKVLVINNNLVAAGRCYLSNYYNPKQNLQTFYEDTDFDKFVSSKYLQHESSDKEQWKEFFINIGVEEEVRFWIYNDKREIQFSTQFGKAYLGVIGLDSNEQKHFFQNFIHYPHHVYFNNFRFSQKIWKYINDNWDRLNLGKQSTVWKNNIPVEVISSFKVSVIYRYSIPCFDEKCHNSSEGIYSNRIRELVGDCYNVCICSLKEEVEDFIGVKRELNVESCLTILDDIAEKYTEHTNKQDRRLNQVFEHLLRCIIPAINEEDKEKIKSWINSGKLLTYNGKFRFINDLFYFSTSLELPPKRNSSLVKFPDSGVNPFQFETILDILGVKKITIDDMDINLDKSEIDNYLPRLIKARSIFIGILLTGKRNILIEKQIKEKVDNIRFYNPPKIFMTCSLIDYKESLSNYYDKDNNSIYYVRKWNSIKNINLSTYLLHALKLDRMKITNSLMLQLLDDDIEDIKEYLLENGYDIGDIPEEEKFTPDPENIQETPEFTDNTQLKPENISSNSIFVYSPDGTGENKEYWGEWGEKKAKRMYELLGYCAEKQSDYLALGYDWSLD
ncbi:transcriptional regulator [Anabaena cylindrica UHCC 0172]|uniref:sacsin N-terminal ATP-binding-like domain-containing protein n=1 Tax=Anabaena cylindrica TaxID=1165 RepID=UPI002B21092C|nr:transcriptional regulator [Anabaena cylindrica]MEA5551203.1 transcriptional regulator [Anabaena cylindrica UHCC 0172]